MSSALVRRAIYDALPVLLPDFVYVPTLNVEVDQESLPAGPWYTVDFQSFESVRVAIGRPGCFTERGIIMVTLASPPDAGDLALADMADQFRAAFLDWFDGTGAMRVYQVNPPLEVDAGDLRGAWWLMEVPMDYEYHRH
jgi:hypothetical protein